MSIPRHLLASIGLAVVVFVVAGEGLTRVSRIVDRLNGFPRALFQATDHPDCPYVMRPGVDLMVRGVRVQVNDYGLRSRPLSMRPAAGTHRLLALGDSATFGEAVAVEDAWPSVLERELARRGRQGWEVVNGGVEGWNSLAEVAWLSARGLALAPETIVVAVNLNDFDYTPHLGPLGILTLEPAHPSDEYSPASWSELYFVIRWLVRTGGHGWVSDPTGAAALPADAARWHPLDRLVSKIRKNYYAQPTDDRWAIYTRSLHRFGDLCRENEIRLLVAILPDGDQFTGVDADLTPQEKLRAVCVEAGLDCLDLFDAFRAAGGDTMFRDIMHPNEAGYRLVAAQIADHLAGR